MRSAARSFSPPCCRTRPAGCGSPAKKPSARWPPCFASTPRQQAIEEANRTEYGLAAYFFTRDHARIWRVGEALEFGVIGVNTGNTSYEGAPFGGLKSSGIGREGSHRGIDEFLETKYLCVAGIGR